MGPTSSPTTTAVVVESCELSPLSLLPLNPLSESLPLPLGQMHVVEVPGDEVVTSELSLSLLPLISLLSLSLSDSLALSVLLNEVVVESSTSKVVSVVSAAVVVVVVPSSASELELSEPVVDGSAVVASVVVDVDSSVVTASCVVVVVSSSEDSELELSVVIVDVVVSLSVVVGASVVV